jgi:hypothetical protein
MRALIGTLVGVSLLVTGCSPAPPSVTEACPAAPVMSEIPPAPDDMNKFDEAAETTLKYAEQLDGFSEAAAEACVTEVGLVWRVVGRDGDWFPVTLDYSPQRVNAVIEKSVVTEISIG